MKPLIVLVGTFVAALLVLRLIQGSFQTAFAARIAMAVMLIFTAIGHFAFTEGMTAMLPTFIPFKTFMVYFTGILEIAFGVGILIPDFRPLVGWIIIAFFIVLLPANIKAALENLNYQTGVYDGPGIVYLWFRIPLQLLFIVWVYFSVVRS